MFNKIANIGILKDNTSRSKSYSSYEKRQYRKKSKENISRDSIVFSPAALFLTEVKWGLSGIDYSAESLIKFNFNIGSVNFKLTIDFNEFYKSSHQEVWISKDSDSLHKPKRYSFKLLIHKPAIRLFEKFPPFEIPGINALFNRAEKMKINSEFYKYEGMAMLSLIDGLSEQMYDDFSKIFFVIYSFIDKLGKYDINHKYIFPRTDLDNIIIEKVLVRND